MKSAGVEGQLQRAHELAGLRWEFKRVIDLVAARVVACSFFVSAPFYILKR